jgi:hypothetical protein
VQSRAYGKFNGERIDQCALREFGSLGAQACIIGIHQGRYAASGGVGRTYLTPTRSCEISALHAHGIRHPHLPLFTPAPHPPSSCLDLYSLEISDVFLFLADPFHPPQMPVPVAYPASQRDVAQQVTSTTHLHSYLQVQSSAVRALKQLHLLSSPTRATIDAIEQSLGTGVQPLTVPFSVPFSFPLGLLHAPTI